MIKIEYVTSKDKDFWYSLDKHLPEREFENKVQNKQGYGQQLLAHWEHYEYSRLRTAYGNVYE